MVYEQSLLKKNHKKVKHDVSFNQFNSLRINIKNGYISANSNQNGGGSKQIPLLNRYDSAKSVKRVKKRKKS